MSRSLILALMLVLLPVSTPAQSQGMAEWQSVCPQSDQDQTQCTLAQDTDRAGEFDESGEEESLEVAFPIIPIPKHEISQEEEEELVEPIPGIEIPEQAVEDLARAIWKVAEEAADELGLDRDCILEGLCGDSSPQ